ncbi:protein kinase domain-containing protein [Streptomyces sp. NBC_00829]|uniref:protein kinase domain-containing protein n=1 Tax=Streptomyces sp. NBC_00829 TaxID=2903679 RepID=UPI00386514A9|nr:protein kinase [Streptomyces sp. NBC_00829]
MDTRGPDRRLIDGRFELLDRLGSGGMGTVWRARDIMLQREVALKEVRPPDPSAQETDPARVRMLRERVLREARALARLAHPQVVTIHHIVESPHEPHPWIVMELVRGQSLHDRLDQGPLPVLEALRVGRGVLSALRAAHDAGIHHRDVKPANVLLRTDGSPVLTDFGIAVLRESSSLTATGDLIGSPEYIAPERIRGEEGNPASDLWSLGMLLYVALEGVHPLRRDTSLSTLVAVLDEPIPAPVRSGALTPVLNALLVRDTTARPDAARLERMFTEAEGDAQRWTPTSAVGAPSPPLGVTPSATPPAASNPYAASSATPPAVSNPYAAQNPTPPAGHPAQPGPYGMPVSDTPPTGYGPPAPFGPVIGLRPPGYPTVVPPPRRKQWRTTAIVVSAAAALTAVVVLAVNGLPGGGDTDNGKSNTPSSSSGDTDAGNGRATGGAGQDGAAQADTATLPPSKETKNLLTPDSVRAAVKAFEDKTKTTKFFEFTVYEEYAIAEVPVQGSRKKYDRWVYRNGYAAKEGPGGTVIGTDGGPVDVSKVKWDILPALMKKADKDLGIAKPTMRYVIVRGPVFEAVPTVNIYLSDAYSSSGYLAADFNGAVLKTYPAEN